MTEQVEQQQREALKTCRHNGARGKPIISDKGCIQQCLLCGAYVPC